MKIIKILPWCLPILLSGCSDPDPTRIVLGTGNNLFEPNDLQYQQPFSVQVTDVDGNPASNTTVTIKLKSLQYYKGGYAAGADSWEVFTNANCPAEDINNNAVLDFGEDLNGNGRLDPTNPATVSEHPTETPTLNPLNGDLVTDSLGFGFFVVTYPQSEANWVRIQLTVTTDGSGTENTEIYDTRLPTTVADLADLGISPPGGTVGKYGIATSCTDPN